MTEYSPLYFVLLLMVLVTVPLFVFLFFPIVKSILTQFFSLEETYKATLTSKDIEQSYSPYSLDGIYPLKTCYSATFYINGNEKRFILKPSEYVILVKGDTGVLKFKGERFISFEKKEL